MRTILILALLGGFAARSQPALVTPRFGLVRDSAGAFRELNGSPGSFLAGTSFAESVQAAAWCGNSGFVHTPAGLQWLSENGLQTVEEQAALQKLLCADGVPARQLGSHLERWTGDRFTAWRIEFPGRVLSVDNGLVLVQDDHGLTLIMLDARRRAVRFSMAVPVEAARAALLDGGILYQQAGELVWWRPGAGTLRAPLPRDCALDFEPLGPGWIHAVDFDRQANLGVRLHDGELQVFELPEVQQ